MSEGVTEIKAPLEMLENVKFLFQSCKYVFLTPMKNKKFIIIIFKILNIFFIAKFTFD